MTTDPITDPRTQPKRWRKVLSLLLSKKLWQRALYCTVYFSAALLVLNDLVLLLARTFFPNFRPDAQVLILDKLLQSITAILGAG